MTTNTQHLRVLLTQLANDALEDVDQFSAAQQILVAQPGILDELDTLRAENNRLRKAISEAAKAMWESESNMDTHAAEAESALQGDTK